MPTLTLSSTPLGTLPAITCSGTRVLASASSVSQARPITYAAVWEVTTSELGGVIGGQATGYIGSGYTSTANTAQIDNSFAATATDNKWHSIQGVSEVTGGAVDVDNVETTGTGPAAISGTALRLCRGGALEFIGNIAETGIFAADSTITTRGNIYSNQHSANGYGTSFP